MRSPQFFLWDLPTRLFHGLLVLCIAAALISGQVGGNWIDWHARFGLAIVGLLVFRLVWGVVGSTYARFSQFFPTPVKLRTYLAGNFQGQGHNPLGAISVFALLGMLLLQVTTGLFSNDDIAFNAPLFDWAGKSLSNVLTGWHKLTANLLIALIGLHIAAVLYYVKIRRDNLLKPMITGWKDGDAKHSAQGGGLIALLIALIIAVAAVYLASGIWLPEPPPQLPTATPNW